MSCLFLVILPHLLYYDMKLYVSQTVFKKFNRERELEKRYILYICINVFMRFSHGKSC